MERVLWDLQVLLCQHLCSSFLLHIGIGRSSGGGSINSHNVLYIGGGGGEDGHIEGSYMQGFECKIVHSELSFTFSAYTM